MAPPCPAGAGVHAAWTPRALAGAFLDLAIVYAFLCAAAAASAASSLLALFSLPLPCTCSRPHLPCLFGFLARYPSRVLQSVGLSLRSRFPFAAGDHPHDDEEEEELVDAEEEEDRDLKREAEEEAGRALGAAAGAGQGAQRRGVGRRGGHGHDPAPAEGEVLARDRAAAAAPHLRRALRLLRGRGGGAQGHPAHAGARGPVPAEGGGVLPTAARSQRR